MIRLVLRYDNERRAGVGSDAQLACFQLNGAQVFEAFGGNDNIKFAGNHMLKGFAAVFRF